MEWMRKYGLLLAALIAPLVLFGLPQHARLLKYFHVLCMVLSTLVGRGFIGRGEVKGWALQSAALLTHAACLVIEGVAFQVWIA